MSCRYVLVTPLVNREWGQAVLVNRGWVPAEWKSDAQLQASGCPAGKVRAAFSDAQHPPSELYCSTLGIKALPIC